MCSLVILACVLRGGLFYCIYQRTTSSDDDDDDYHDIVCTYVLLVRIEIPYMYTSLPLQVFVFYPRDAMLARVIVIATCLSVRPSVRPSRAGIVSKRRKLSA